MGVAIKLNLLRKRRSDLRGMKRAAAFAVIISFAALSLAGMVSTVGVWALLVALFFIAVAYLVFATLWIFLWWLIAFKSRPSSASRRSTP